MSKSFEDIVINIAADSDPVIVLFRGPAGEYLLSAGTPRFDEIVETLRESLRSRKAVVVSTSGPDILDARRVAQ